MKLHFILHHPEEGSPRAERMWVEITEKEPAGKKYFGILTNQPAYIQSLNRGDTVEFETKHIATTLKKRTDPHWLEIGEKMALVSKKCFENKEIVRWMYRETPDREDDSGWRIFTGTESEEYTSDFSNVAIVSVYYLVEKDSSLITPFRASVGSAFEREDLRSPWREVKDWEIDTDSI